MLNNLAREGVSFLVYIFKIFGGMLLGSCDLLVLSLVNSFVILFLV